MAQEILSLAIWEPIPGHEADALESFNQIKSITSRKSYARDLLYRDGNRQYVFMRYWKSEDARRSAQEDPEMLRCWAKLGNEIQIVKVYETLTEIQPSAT
jgi:hypothetical protein